MHGATIKRAYMCLTTSVLLYLVHIHKGDDLLQSCSKVSTIAYLSAELMDKPRVTSDKMFSVDDTNTTHNPKDQSHILPAWYSDLCRGGGSSKSR
jgi:hypothetical protein